MSSLFSVHRPSLENQRFHVIVIGGGINGVAVARECARSGRSTLLVEQTDFASGTTSRSTRIIHGGLRYLEHGELGLVRESLTERRKLQREYSHLVHPMQFLLALDENSRRSGFKIRTGLWLYRMIAGGRRPAANSKDALNKLERSLDQGRQWSIFSYQDAQCEFPERLVAEWLVEAVAAGAVARNHTQVLAVDIRQGRAYGILIRDQLTGAEERVEGSWIINATGPWVDRICKRSQIKTPNPMVGGVRGSHVVLPRFPGAPDAAVYTEATDGRPIFVIPWNDQILVGTTEVKDNGDPAKTRPSAGEIEYLLQSAGALFPHAKISATDVRYAFAGVRPLPYAPEAALSGLSRKHYLHDHTPDGAGHMISLIGGKLTTAGALAQECARKIGATPVKKASDMAQLPSQPDLLEVKNLDPLLDQFVTDIANTGSISENSAAGIVGWHGKRSASIALMATRSAEFRAPLCPHTEHIVAEAVDAVATECAITLADILLRRVPLSLGACWSVECTQHAAKVLRPVMGWSERQVDKELEIFHGEWAGFLGKSLTGTQDR